MPPPSLINAIAVEADNASLRRRVRMLEKELVRQSVQLAARTDFMTRMSHDLRAPLNGVVGMSQLLMGTPLNAEQEELVGMLARSTEGVLAMVNDVLDFAKLEFDGLRLEKAPFDLGDLVESVFDVTARAAAEKGIGLAFLTHPGTPDRLVGDAARIRQVLVNLVSNAVKFTFEGDVVVRARVEWPLPGSPACHLVVDVADTGIGIVPERLATLFEAYPDPDAGGGRRSASLGLPIARRLALLMHGDLTVSSQPHHGSTFTLQVPLTAAPAPASAPRFAGQSVLVADAHRPTLDMITQLISRAGLTVIPACTLGEALTALDNGGLAAALYSSTLADGTGTRLLHRARQHAGGAHLPAIEYHGWGQRPEGTTVTTLTTPVHRTALLQAVGELLAGPSDDGGADAGPREMPPAELRILLAEDNAINQMVALRLLESLGYRADVVENGLEAVEAAQRRAYDVILMDIMMPVMDGLEATRRIRKAGLAHPPRIIAVTANALAGDRQRCLDAGMDEHIPKPLRLDVLAQALRKAPTRAFDAPPSRPAPGPSERLDYTALRTLRASVGEDDASFFDELLADFLADARQLLADLAAALAEGNAAAARRAVHTLKSSAAMFGAMQLSDAAREAEMAAKEDDLEKVRSLEGDIAEQFDAAAREIETLRAEGMAGL